ncbi:hypothetical protein [Rhizobium sp. Root483D2]|uniref:SPOR domain-containing protein n=1 Tax=Rhizobium sp. Root483D2 TaxID=1736545 RepID=UPI000AC3A833|nr:hypothetical protein [Rhizobium sp. Root483D2]
MKKLPYKILIAAVILSTAVSGTAFADVTARYGELQSVIDAINDPDPLMRLAQLEEILKKGNATEVQLAIRTAFSLDDANVRSLALRVHFAGFRTFVVTAALPDGVKTVLAGSDKQAAKETGASDLLRFFERTGYQFSFQSEYPGSDALEFAVKFLNNERPNVESTGSGNIRGGMITVTTPVTFENSPKACSFEFTQYQGFTLKGFGSCNIDDGFLFPVTLHLFDNDKPPLGN